MSDVRITGWLDRFRSADLYQQMIVLYALLYAGVSLGLEHGLGIIGFSKTPYLNAVGYGFMGAVLVAALLLNRVRLSILAVNPLAILVLVALAASTIIGIANGNAVSYIIAWNVYILTGVAMFQLFSNLRDRPASDPVGLIVSMPTLGFLLVAAALSVFSRDNLYQYMLAETIALHAMFLRRSLVEKSAGALLFAAIHLGSGEGFVQVEINRASILAVTVTGLIFLIYRRMFLTIVFLAAIGIGGLSYALSLDDATIETLPRNIREALLLMKGDDIYKHVSSYQRIYEGEKVMEDLADASSAEMLFGKGLGRTVDMSGAADRTVGQHALLGILDVHNIHFIHYAIIHKFGLVGLGVFGLLVITIAGMLVIDLARGRMDDALFFFYLYVIYVLVFAVPASNHLIGNPIWAASLGMLVTLRRAR